MDNCDPLETFSDGEVVISCWQMSAEELAEVSRNGGRVWVRVWSGRTAPPISVEVDNPFVPPGPHSFDAPTGEPRVRGVGWCYAHRRWCGA